ncbi:hypothetical protein B296_00050445 [Ensete ventricosum]|uniref:Tyrosine specific protein phosphatases domain-containing protein n=1 Tax=Ensete ventricosum TaxID=4639 RepID=A0A426XR78_ENSVE|nr:hypothetical protein B296_00050445 [Ensete ventricosum]
MLDLVLRNEDRLPCPQLGWRGNQANLLFSIKVASANMDALNESYDCRKNKPRIVKSLRKERRASSVNGGLGSQGPELTAEDSDDCIEYTDRSSNNHATEYGKTSNFHIVAIDSLVPRRPPAGKRARDLESYPRVVELIINNYEFSSNLLYKVSFGKLGFPGPEHTDAQIDSCSLCEFDMVAVVHAFRQGFRAALRDLQSFHIFLLTLYQKLEGLFQVLLTIINKCFSESDKDESGASESPSNSSWCSFNSHFQACKEHGAHETHADSSDSQSRRCSQKSSGFRESIDIVYPVSRDNWNGRYSKGCGEAPRSLRLTMKLRDFNKCTKVCDNDDEDISNLFEEASDFIDYVERLGGKILVHCFEGKSRSATVVLAYLMLRK